MGRYTNADAKIAGLAQRQHGAFSYAQATHVGLSHKAMRSRLDQRRFEIGDFAHVLAIAGSPPTELRRTMSAVLAAGPTAFASHSTGGGLFSMPVMVQTRPEVTVVLERHPRIDGVRVHRSGLLVERDVTMIDGIPVATPERTIVDLSGRLATHELSRVVDDALRRHITSLGRIMWTLERLPRAPGRSPKRVREVMMRRLDHGVES